MRYRKITLSLLIAPAFLAMLPAPVQADSVTFADRDRSGSPAASVAPRSFREFVLTAHNDERGRWRVPPLAWDEKLARDAQAYAQRLTRLGYLQHASTAGLADPQGENLWMGTRGAFNYGQMMDGFLSERRNYVAGAVPYISRTGNWTDTGHYSQIIWRTTTSVGCAMASSQDFDYLVCRYWPAGNVWGRRADDRDQKGSSAVAMNDGMDEATDENPGWTYSLSYNWP